MNDKELNERVVRLIKVGKVIEKLPQEIRSEAFGLLKGYITKRSDESNPNTKDSGGSSGEGQQTKEEFFEAFDHGKPAENAKLIAAYFYREYGTEPFSLDEVRQMAHEVGLTIPSRVDSTYLAAQEGGKKLFIKTGKGKFKPTVYGEASLKAGYSIKKGTRMRRDGEE